jgi:hypothetical protein
VKRGEAGLPMTAYKGVFMSMMCVFSLHVHVLAPGAINPTVASQPFTLHTILHDQLPSGEACEVCEASGPVQPARLKFHEPESRGM